MTQQKITFDIGDTIDVTLPYYCERRKFFIYDQEEIGYHIRSWIRFSGAELKNGEWDEITDNNTVRSTRMVLIEKALKIFEKRLD